MVNNVFGKSGKRAAITIEFFLAALLGIVVLFLVIGIFGNNLKNMAVYGNMPNMFVKNDISKAHYDDWHIKPANTEVNVQIVADQGLDQYLAQAQCVISKYRNYPCSQPGSPPPGQDPCSPQKSGVCSKLTDSEIFNLAKAATIAKIIEKPDTTGVPVNSLSSADASLLYTDPYGKILVNLSGKTSNGVTTYITKCNISSGPSSISYTINAKGTNPLSSNSNGGLNNELAAVHAVKAATFK